MARVSPASFSSGPPADKLVTAEWLLAHLTDPLLRVVEVDEDVLLYERGHIPGAVSLDWQSELQDPVRRDLLSCGDFEALMTSKGIGPQTTVILYGDGSNRYAAYAFWVLTLRGHEDIRLLDGGRRRWEVGGLPLTRERPNHATATYRASPQNPTVRAFRDEVFRQMESSSTLIDTRSAAEYRGHDVHAVQALPLTGMRKGHIPGAISIPWDMAVRQEDGTFRNTEELREVYESACAIPRDNTVITYCLVGERSSHTWFVLSVLLGFPHVRNYDGSWCEWGSMIAAPIER